MGFLSHKKDKAGAPLPARRREVEGVRTRALEERRVATHDVQPEGAQVFRRNRTLSNAEKAPLNSVSPRAIHHHLRGKRRSLTMLLMGSIALVCVLTFALYQLSAQFTVSLYGSIDSISDENQASYRATINRYLAERPSERLRILLDTDSLSNYLWMHGHSEVSDVTAVHGIGLGKTEVEIKVREPVARWTVDGNLQYVDNSGVVFSKNYYKSPSIQIVDKSGVSLDSGTVASSRFLAFVGRVIGALQEFGYTTTEVIIPPETTRQVQLKMDNGVLAKLAVDRPAGEQAEDVANALDYIQKQKSLPDYIDVRVSGRAYYK